MRVTASIPLLLIIPLMFVFSGPAPVRGQGASGPKIVDRGMVYVLDGSGRLRLMADDLHSAVADAGLPLDVQEFNWSHGSGRVLFDLRSRFNHAAKGDQLADTILAHRRSHPRTKVFLVAHSAGSAVALAAADRLPANSMERMVLLAPALSPGCSMRAALLASRGGVDVFHSGTDLISLGLALTGTADGENVLAAGANGFAEAIEADSPSRLRQHGYTSDMSRTGHYGGHYGWTKLAFLRQYVVPMLTRSK